MVRAVNEIEFKPKMIGGAMNPQSTALKFQLGSLRNGFIVFDFWAPVPKLNFPGIADFLQKIIVPSARRRRGPAGGTGPPSRTRRWGLWVRRYGCVKRATVALPSWMRTSQPFHSMTRTEYIKQSGHDGVKAMPTVILSGG
jgi:hypothetical protein